MRSFLVVNQKETIEGESVEVKIEHFVSIAQLPPSPFLELCSFEKVDPYLTFWNTLMSVWQFSYYMVALNPASDFNNPWLSFEITKE